MAEGITTYLIPLQFYFCNNPGLYIPLLALQYSPIRINITLTPLQQLFWANPYNYPAIVPNPVSRPIKLETSLPN